MKLIWLAALTVVGWRLATGRWPPLWKLLRTMGYRNAGGQQPARDALAEARTLLGLAPGADRAQIAAAHRALIARVHPDRGGNSAAVHAADAARDLLLAELSWDERAA